MQEQIDQTRLTKDLTVSQERLNELIQQLNALDQQRQLVLQEILRLQGQISLLQSYLQVVGEPKEEKE